MSNVNTLRVGGTDYAIEDPSKANASQIATIESGATASAAHVAGEFIYHSGTLYVVTAPISAGDTLTVGTNIQATTVGSELKTIKTDLSDYHVYASKNLMMPDIYMLGTNDSTIGASTFYTASAGTGFIAKIDQNTDYVISRVGGNRSRIALSVDVPAAGGACNIINVDNDVTEKSFNSGAYNYIYIYASNTSATYETIKPMVCTAAEWAASHTWVAYWQAMRDGMFPRSEQRVLGAKNRLNNTGTSTGIFTVNADKTVKANGTPTGDAARYDMISDTLPAGSYIYTGCPAGGADNGYRCVVRLDDAYGDSFGYDIGAGIAFTLTTAHKIFVRIFIPQNMQVANLIFKPMIRLASDPDDTYAPYAMTNRELTTDFFTALFSHPVTLTSSDNLNDITTPGLYAVISSVPTNAPTGMSNTFAVVLVFNMGNSAAYTQIYIQGGWRQDSKHIAIRGFGGSPAAWSAWRYVTDATS